MTGEQEIITSLGKLGETLADLPGGPPLRGLERVTERHPLRTNSYYTGLILHADDPIWRQSVPSPLELEREDGLVDPLAEEALSPVPNLVHRYPDRVLWLVSSVCAMHCRFCTRKRRWLAPRPLDDQSFQAGLEYIEKHPEIRDVLLSGGDPLMLPFEKLEAIIAALRKVEHVGVIRIGTRVPCTLPQRITADLARMLSRYHPIYMNIHFNHPREITPESERACTLLANAGIPLGSQTVLLKGVNDDPKTLRELFEKLLRMRVRPYYLLQMDLTLGTAHFRTPLASGLRIIQALRNHISGLAVPQFVVDLPGGKGKMPLLPNSILKIGQENLVLKNFRGETCEYPLLSGESEELSDWLPLHGKAALAGK
ncbi:MAG: KamA family radical SAM protein [Syntrophobacteraceae bacterium]